MLLVLIYWLVAYDHDNDKCVCGLLFSSYAAGVQILLHSNQNQSTNSSKKVQQPTLIPSTKYNIFTQNGKSILI